ncbi:MAG: Gfo/Idh/MocA family oxidoreductase [Candidatus Omnitrophota bacterium]
MNKKNAPHTLPRRGFMKAASAGAGLMLVKPESVFGAPANSLIQAGLIGCGGRGTHDAGVFVRMTDTRFIALADYFEDRLQSTKNTLDGRLKEKGQPEIEASKLFKGMKSYEDVLAIDDIDMVLITSPVYFHPIHFEAAVNAGKHIYMEKPAGADVAGVKKVIEAGRKANGKKSMMIGFQIRFSLEFQEAVNRVHQGDIGDPVSGMVNYHAGRLGGRNLPNATEEENRLRNWVFDKALSGDIIVEQNVHVIDVCNWYLQNHPVKAFGTGGRKARVDIGDCWDHFICIFWYPNDVRIDFSSSQFLRGWGDCRERIFGTRGTANTPYTGNAEITGDKSWQSENTDLLGGTEERKVTTFIESVKSGNYANETLQAAESTLTCILGRIAAYEERMVTWDEMMKSNLTIDPKLKL